MNEVQRTGTREWSEHSFNCCLGCGHGCLYCYARFNALRFGRIRGGEDWTSEFPRTGAKSQAAKRYDGVVMFPTTHDFTPANLSLCMDVLERLLKAGNQVLVVTKTGLTFASEICRVLKRHPREQSELRFSITCLCDGIRAFWEPQAPTIVDRLEGLQWAYRGDVRTSASAEPLLEPLMAAKLVAAIAPLTESVWIGKANKLRQRTKWIDRAHGVMCALSGLDQVPLPRFSEVARVVNDLEAQQTDEAVMNVVCSIEALPAAIREKVRWKDSYATVIGKARGTRHLALGNRQTQNGEDQVPGA